MLYPLKFHTIYKEKIWGGSKLKSLLFKNIPSDKTGESWEVSGVEGNISVVSNGFLQGRSLKDIIPEYKGLLLGKKIYNQFGIEFPLLIKFIDANDDLSIQVHPDDNISDKRHNSFGKTEMWYVIETEKDAELISGVRKKTSKDEYSELLSNKKIKNILNFEKVKKGDVFFIPAGRIHAICKGILLAEIQQTSDITYRIYDWDRTDENGNSRELHTELALDVIDFDKKDDYRTEYDFLINESVILESCKYFTTNLLCFDRGIEKDYKEIDSFVIYICLHGNFEINFEDKTETVNKGETVLIPAELDNIKLLPMEKSEILEVYIE